MPLSNDEIIAIINAHRSDALGADDSDLSTQRAEAMDRYYGRYYGDEEDGKSKIVSKDLSETVDWIMPAIMKAFLQGGDIAEFEPIDDDDEAQTIQETEYIDHIFMKDNQGFIILYDSIRDALLLKNGYVKHYWDESEVIRERMYSGLTNQQLIKLFLDYDKEGAELEILEQEEETEIIDGAEIPVFTIKVKITKKVNRCVIEAIPPEEVRISKACRGSTQDSPFVEHITTKTRTELIEMGMDEGFVSQLPAYNDNTDDETVISRNSVSDETDTQEGLSVDRSMDDIEYAEAYLKIDADGDGKAELRRIVTVGNRIPPGDEWNQTIDCVPITGMISKRVPHRHIGESLHDDLSDLMRIKTFLYRQMFDNIYSTNNIETIVNKRVHLPDFMQSLPGGYKRITDDLPVQDAVMHAPVQPITDKILPAIDSVDRIKAGRTGISEVTTVQNPDVLRDSTNKAFQTGLQQAGQKVEMILRTLAETGVKELILRIHEILIKHQDVSRKIKITGGYVDINPSHWRERTGLSVKVGLGTGSKDEQRQNLGIVNELFLSLIQPAGLGTPAKAYNLFRDISKTLDIVSPDKYALDPESEEYQQLLQQQAAQGDQNPLAEAEQVKGLMQIEADKLKGQFKLESDRQKQAFDAAIQQAKQQYEAELEIVKQQMQSNENEADRVSKEGIETLKAEVELLKASIPKDIGKPGLGAEIEQQSD